MDWEKGEYGLGKESMDREKGEYGLFIGRVWTVYRES